MHTFPRFCSNPKTKSFVWTIIMANFECLQMCDIYRMDKLRGAHRLPTESILLWKTFRKTNAKQFSPIYFYQRIYIPYTTYDRICVDVSYVCVYMYIYIASSQSSLTIIMAFPVSVLLTNAIRSRLISVFSSSNSHSHSNNIIHCRSPSW